MDAKKQDVFEARVMVGEMLKLQREALELTKAEITRKVGNRNINFVCKLEKGEAIIPIAKFMDFMDAYQLPNEKMKVIFQQLYPDTWQLLYALCWMISKMHGRG